MAADQLRDKQAPLRDKQDPRPQSGRNGSGLGAAWGTEDGALRARAGQKLSREASGGQ